MTASESAEDSMSGSAATSLIRKSQADAASAGQAAVNRAAERQAQARQAQARQAPEGQAPGRRPDLATALRPLAIDIGIPLGTYYLLHGALGLSLWLSLALSSVGPAVRAVSGLAAERTLNLLAVLMLAVNVAGIVVSLLTGDPRAMIAKDSLISSVIAIAILASVVLRRPLMSAGLKPFVTRACRNAPRRGTDCPQAPPGSGGSRCCSARSGAWRCWPSASPGWWAPTRCR